MREKYGQKLVVYGSTQTHSIAKKVSPGPIRLRIGSSWSKSTLSALLMLQAAVILGLEFRAVPVSVKDDYGLRGEPLRKVMQADQDAGYVPFFVGKLSPSSAMSSPLRWDR